MSEFTQLIQILLRWQNIIIWLNLPTWQHLLCWMNCYRDDRILILVDHTYNNMSPFKSSPIFIIKSHPQSNLSPNSTEKNNTKLIFLSHSCLDINLNVYTIYFLIFFTSLTPCKEWWRVEKKWRFLTTFFSLFLIWFLMIWRRSQQRRRMKNWSLLKELF